ncbi:MAG: amidase [Pseudomonadota bacterium]
MAALTQSLYKLAQLLENGELTALQLIEHALAQSQDEHSEVKRIFTDFQIGEARKQALKIDALRKQNRHPSPFAGIPLSVKDLFDLEGQVTTAGSILLKDRKPAFCNAHAIDLLLKAGMINVGRTNMSEFAYSGVGLNPHYGTPAGIWLEPDDMHKKMVRKRIPGGSSSGAAVSVAEQIVPLGIGTDTGGSCRVPAAFNGICGFKSSHGRVSTRGVFPLAKSLDSVGPLCADIDSIFLADLLMRKGYDQNQPLKLLAIERGLKIGVVQDLVLDDLDPKISDDFTSAIKMIEKKGHQCYDIHIRSLKKLPEINASGGISAVEAYHVHQAWLSKEHAKYDPRIHRRICSAEQISAIEYAQILQFQHRLQQIFASIYQEMDCLIMPSVPIIAPLIADLESDDQNYARANFTCLRNSFVANFAKQCAISIPMHKKNTMPTGLMLMTDWGFDDKLLSIAKAIFNIFKQ